MKKVVILLSILAISSLGFYGCGSNMDYDGKTYTTYGSLNRDAVKDDNVIYREITGNIVWGFIIPVPLGLYFFGFSMYEPIGFKHQKTEPKPEQEPTPPVPEQQVPTAPAQ